MAKIVYNADYGGFHLSGAAIALGRKLSGNPQWCEASWGEGLARHDHTLVAVIEALGDDAHYSSDHFGIREVPDGSLYRVHEYDGSERVILQSEENWEVAK